MKSTLEKHTKNKTDSPTKDLEQLKKQMTQTKNKEEKETKQNTENGPEYKTRRNETIHNNHDEALEKALNAIPDSNETMPKTEQSKIDSAKQTIKKAQAKVGTLGIGETFKKVGNKIGGILGKFFKFIGRILSGITEWFGFGKSVKELTNKTNSEEIKKTKDSVNTYILNHFGDTLTEENKKKLTESVHSLSQKQILELNKKIKDGKLTLTDVQSITPNIFNDFLQEEQIKKMKEKLQSKIVTSIKNDIASQYSITLEGDKLQKLQNLVQKHMRISDANKSKITEINESQTLKNKDIFGAAMDAIINSTLLFLGLFTQRIIPISALAIDLSDAGFEVLKLSAHAIGVSKFIDLDTIAKLDSEDRALILGLLYRKGGPFLSIVGSMSESLSRIAIEAVTKTSVKRTSLVNATFSKGHMKQIENFEKLVKSLGGYQDNSTEVLKRAVESLNAIKQNYQILDILRQSNGDTSKAIELLNKANIKIPDGAIGLPFKEFVEKFKNNAVKLTDSFSIGKLKSVLGFGAEADLFRLQQQIENISRAQSRMFTGNFISKGYMRILNCTGKGVGKIQELFRTFKISRLSDRMVLHVASIQEAQQKLSRWNILANQFPDLVKGVFGKLPIIAVAGDTLISEGPFLETFGKNMKYLIPLFGPWLIVRENEVVKWDNGSLEIKNLKDNIILGSLIAFDASLLIGTSVKGWFNGGLRGALTNIGLYMSKPFTDGYSLIKGTLQGIYSVGKAVTRGEGITQALKSSLKYTEKIKKPLKGIYSVGKEVARGKGIPQAIKSFLTYTKNIKNPRIKALAFGACMLYFVPKVFFDSPEIDKILGEEGKIDKEKLAKQIKDLEPEEKKICLQYLIKEKFGKSYTDDIVFEIDNNNTLSIISNNPNIQADWIVDAEMLEILDLNYDVKFTFNNKGVNSQDHLANLALQNTKT